MIYEIIRQSDSKTWHLENPAFVRLNTENVYCLTNESNAHAVYIEGICYHILGKAPIQGLDDVTVGVSGQETYSNVEVKQKLDAQETTNASVSSNLDDLWVAVLEA